MAKKERKKGNGEEGNFNAVRSYRFDNELWARFEERCGLNIYNPRSVLEALVLDWLSSDEAHHKELAKKYHEWLSKHQ
jgi:hypothetical protein